MADFGGDTPVSERPTPATEADGGDRRSNRAHTTGAALEAHYRFVLWLGPTAERFPRSQKCLLGDGSWRRFGWGHPPAPGCDERPPGVGVPWDASTACSHPRTPLIGFEATPWAAPADDAGRSARTQPPPASMGAACPGCAVDAAFIRSLYRAAQLGAGERYLVQHSLVTPRPLGLRQTRPPNLGATSPVSSDALRTILAATIESSPAL